MNAIYQEIANLMVKLKPCVALTGAGISAESGIPTFRSKGGLWEKYDPMPEGALETAYHESATCKLMLVIGTSAVVQPAASLPVLAQQKGAKIVEVNIERVFPGADLVVAEKAGLGLSGILEEIKKIVA